MTKQIPNEFSAVLDKLTARTPHTSSELIAVLDKLASDDDFRERLLADPVATLANLGIKLDPSRVPAERSLPSKGSVVADQSVLQERLETTNSMIIFLLSGND